MWPTCALFEFFLQRLQRCNNERGEPFVRDYTGSLLFLNCCWTDDGYSCFQKEHFCIFQRWFCKIWVASSGMSQAPIQRVEFIRDVRSVKVVKGFYWNKCSAMIYFSYMHCGQDIFHGYFSRVAHMLQEIVQSWCFKLLEVIMMQSCWMQCVGGTHGASSAWNASCAAQTSSQQVTSKNVLALYCSSSCIILTKCILAQWVQWE